VSMSATSQLPYIGPPINLNVAPLCFAGQFINASTDAVGNYSFLRSVSNVPCSQCEDGSVSLPDTIQSCMLCPVGSYANANHTQCVQCTGNSWSPIGSQNSCLACNDNFTSTFEKDNCVSLKFSHAPPVSVASATRFVLPPIIVESSIGVTVSSHRCLATVALVCVPPQCDTDTPTAFQIFTADVSIVNGSSHSNEFSFVENSASRTGTGYQWRLVCDRNSTLPYIEVLRGGTMFTGTPPTITAVFPPILSFLGGTVTTVTSAWGISKRITTPANSSAFCVFSHMLPFSTVISTIVKTAAGNDKIKTCISPAIPEFLLVNVSIILEDGRLSRHPFPLVSGCPFSHFLENGTKCARCPDSLAGSSFNQLVNAPSIESCRCGIGNYGTFGYGCKRCPPMLKGFNCSVPDKLWPTVNPGFWGDFSLLSTCDLQSGSCSAIVTCPYGEKACPGGTEKLCTSRDDACYEGRACSRCCPRFYLESENCIPCPEQGTLMLILAVICIVVVIMAIFVSTSSSPSATQSTKYLVLGMNFFQGIGSIKLINIEWPSIIIQMFDVMQYFSFSLSAVRPECAFSWSFELKVSLTLLLPILLSFLVCFYGVYKSGYSCWKLYKVIQNLQSNGCKLPLTTYRSILSCWAHVVFFRNVAWKPELVIWFALCPELGARLATKENMAVSNWQTAKSKLKRRVSVARFLGSMGVSRPSTASDFALEDVVKVLHDNGDMDTQMHQIVFYSRKYFSGVFSILIFSFVGTLTAALSATLCTDSDGGLYLRNEPTIECVFESAKYRNLFLMSMSAIFVYGIFMPVLVLILLRSSWSQMMRIHDRNGYDALFGFLTSRYTRHCYLWEVIVFVNKALSVIIPAYNYGHAFKQSVGMMSASLFYTVLLFRFTPFANKIMNLVSITSNTVIFFMYFCAVLFLTEFDNEPVFDSFQKSIVAACMTTVSLIAIILLVLSAFYESTFLMMFHQDVLVSKWILCLESALGDSIKTNSVFSYFYVFYNATTRADILRKRELIRQALESPLKALQGSVGDIRQQTLAQRLWFNTRDMWIRFWFRVKHLDIAVCHPVTISNAIQSPEAKFLQCLNKIEQSLSLHRPMHPNKMPGKKPGMFSRCMSLLRSNRISPDAVVSADSDFDAQMGDTDPPREFLDWISKFNSFVEESLSPRAISIFLSLVLLEDQDGYLQSLQAQRYFSRICKQIIPAKKSIIAIYHCLQHLEEIDSNSTEPDAGTWHIQRARLIGSLMGGQMLCLTRFHKLTDDAIDKLLIDCNFEGIPSINLSTTSNHLPLYSGSHLKSTAPIDTTSSIKNTALASQLHERMALRVRPPFLHSKTLLQKVHTARVDPNSASQPEAGDVIVGHGRTSLDHSVHSLQDTSNLEQQSLIEALQIERDHLTAVTAERNKLHAERNELQSKFASALKELGDLNAHIVSLQERVDKTSSEFTEDIVVPMQTSILDVLSKYSATDSIAAARSSVLGFFVESRRTALGISHPATLDMMTSLANDLRMQGRVVEAEPIYKQCLELREEALGPSHASTLSSLNNYASICQLLYRADEAERMHKKCLDLRTKTLGWEHPNTMASIYNLGSLYTSQGRFAEAEPLFAELLKYRSKTLGNDHRDVMECSALLAGICASLGKFAQSKRLYGDAIRTGEMLLGKEHLHVMQWRQNQEESVLALWKQSIEEFDEKFKSAHDNQ
jgi:tetratricopeptide (TPR) repeat protein